MKFAELTEKQQKRVFNEIVQMYIDRGERTGYAYACAVEYIEEKDNNEGFRLVDYSPDEDGTDIRVEY